MSIMRFTTFSGIYDTKPNPYDGWDEFKKLFKLVVTPDKDSVHLYCPAEYATDHRLDDNVMCLSFGVIDIDTASLDQVLDALNELQKINLQIIFHTTHSHLQGLKVGKYKCRIIIPFSRPVEPEEWSRVWHGMNRLVGGIADPACKNPSRMYYFPSCPAEGEDEARVEAINENGVVLDIDNMLALVPDVSVEERWVPDFDPEILNRVGASVRYGLAKEFLYVKYPGVAEGGTTNGLGRNQTAYKVSMTCGDFGLNADEGWPLVQDWNQRCTPPLQEKELARTHRSAFRDNARALPFGWRLLAQTKGDDVQKNDISEFITTLKRSDEVTARHIRRILNGDPIGADAVPIFKSVAETLGRKFTSVDPDALALIFQESIEATHKAGHRDITVEFVAARIRDTHTREQADSAKDQLKRQIHQRVTMQDAYRSVGASDRATAYSESEWERFTKDAGLTSVEELKQRLVIRCGPSYYFFVGGQYSRRPYKDDAYDMAQRALAPAQVDLFRTGSKGPIPMKLSEIMTKYGTVAREIILDMAADKSFFDSKSQILTEAPCPLRVKPEEAAFDERVDTWLRLMGGPMGGKLLDWLASVPLLHEPIAGLFLYGRKQSGKSLLPYGVARLWLDPLQGGPSSLQSVADTDFNDGMKKCPILFADEGQIPQDHHGPRTAYLRDLIQAVSQPWKPKGFANGTIKGAYRVMISANDPDKLVGRSWLTNDAIEAINERILCVKIDDNQAMHYLQKLKKDRANRDFFVGDAIPKHIWWLHQNRKVEYESRFLVAGLPGSELEMSLMTGSGARASICQWLTEYLLKEESARVAGGVTEHPLFNKSRGGKTRYLVTSKILDTLWGTVLPTVQMPPRSVLGKALGALSNRQAVKVPGDDGVRREYRAVDIGRLKYWAVNDGYGEEVFDAALTKAGVSIPPLPVWWSKSEDGDEDDD